MSSMRKPTNGVGTVQTSDISEKEAKLCAFLGEKKLRYISDAILLGEVDSTNTFCRSESVKLGTVVTAMRQSAGHGRLGRSFSSEQGGVYASFCVAPPLTAEALGLVTGITAAAVLRTASRAARINGQVKWLNDIILGGKKICGILTECVFSGGALPEKVIIGIGFNLNQPEDAFSGELGEIASSVYALTGRKSDELEFIRALCEELDAALCAAESGDISEYLELYRRNCVTIGKNVHILACDGSGRDPKEVFSEAPELFPPEKAVGITDRFELITERRVVRSGEASIKEQY